jgi:hypothetical protein
MKKLILILLTTTITAFAQDAHPLRYSLQYLSLPKDEGGGIFYFEEHIATELVVFGIISGLYEGDPKKIKDLGLINKIIDSVLAERSRDYGHFFAKQEIHP